MKTMIYQHEVRHSFWQYLKEVNPELYAKGKRGKRQNEQVTDIRVMFVDYVDSLRRDGQITESLANRVTL